MSVAINFSGIKTLRYVTGSAMQFKFTSFNGGAT